MNVQRFSGRKQQPDFFYSEKAEAYHEVVSKHELLSFALPLALAEKVLYLVLQGKTWVEAVSMLGIGVCKPDG